MTSPLFGDPPRTWRVITREAKLTLAMRLCVALERHGWSLAKTARELDIRSSTLQSLIQQHGLGKDYAARAPKPGRPKKA